MTIISGLLTFVTLIFCCNTLEAQSDTLRLAEIGWTALIPVGFKTADAQKVQASVKKGISAIEDATDMTVDTHSLQTLASYYKEELNMFSVTIQRYDPATDGSYDSVSLSATRLLYMTMKKNMPKCAIDSSYSKRLIGGQTFNAYRMDFRLNDRKLMTMMMYSCWRKGYDTGITFVALNKDTFEQIEDMLTGSRFASTVSN